MHHGGDGLGDEHGERATLAVPELWPLRAASPSGPDGSGFSPKALGRLLDLCIRLPYREAQAALEIQGLSVAVSHCERLSQVYGACCEALRLPKGFSRS